MRKLFSILLMGCMIFSLTACGNKENTNVNVDFGTFEEINKDDAIVNDSPVNNETVSDIQTSQDSDNVEENDKNVIIDNGEYKISYAEYSSDLLESDMSSKRVVNGVVNSIVHFEGDFLNFVGVSWPATQESFNEVKELSYEEAINFRETYADIVTPAENSWIEENFTEDKLYLLVNSTTFNRLYSAFPNAKYDEETNSIYLVFEKGHSHWYVNPVIQNIEERIDEEAQSTATLLILNKNEVKNLDALYIVTPPQFVEEEDDIEVAWGIFNEDKLTDENDSLMGFMLFKANQEFPEGFLEVTEDGAKEFIKNYFDIGDVSQTEIEQFLDNKKIFIIRDDELNGANNLATNVRAIEEWNELYIELYSDVDAVDKGTECVVVALDLTLYDKYKEISFVVDDN